MKKIPSLFQRDFEGDRSKVLNTITPGTEWVIKGEGVATIKYDGTACAVIEGKLYARYDCKPEKAAYKQHVEGTPWDLEDFKQPPDSAIACQEPDLITGHWPHWVLVEDQPQYKYHAATWEGLDEPLPDGTYELVGPKVSSNPHGLGSHYLWPHGEVFPDDAVPPRTFDTLHRWFQVHSIEGIVWYHNDGRMVKIKRRDFGLPWPVGGGEDEA